MPGGKPDSRSTADSRSTPVDLESTVDLESILRTLDRQIFSVVTSALLFNVLSVTVHSSYLLFHIRETKAAIMHVSSSSHVAASDWFLCTTIDSDNHQFTKRDVSFRERAM